MAGSPGGFGSWTGKLPAAPPVMESGGWAARPGGIPALSHKACASLMRSWNAQPVREQRGAAGVPGIPAPLSGPQTAFFVAALLGMSPRLRVVFRATVAAPYYLCMRTPRGGRFYRTVWRRGRRRWVFQVT